MYSRNSAHFDNLRGTWLTWPRPAGGEPAPHRGAGTRAAGRRSVRRRAVPAGAFSLCGAQRTRFAKKRAAKIPARTTRSGSPGVASARVLGGGRPARGCGVQFARPFFSHRRRGVHNSMEPSEKGGRGDGSGCEQRRCGADVRVRRWCGAGRVSMRAVVLAVCLLPCTCSAFSTVLLRCCAV